MEGAAPLTEAASETVLRELEDCCLAFMSPSSPNSSSSSPSSTTSSLLRPPVHHAPPSPFSFPTSPPVNNMRATKTVTASWVAERLEKAVDVEVVPPEGISLDQALQLNLHLEMRMIEALASEVAAREVSEQHATAGIGGSVRRNGDGDRVGCVDKGGGSGVLGRLASYRSGRRVRLSLRELGLSNLG